MKYDVEHKVVVITGASSGIGAETAILLNNLGAKVVLASRSVDELNAIAGKCNATKNTLVVQTDVTIEDQCKNLISKTIEHFECIDILICNAGLSMRGLIDKTPSDVFKRLMDVNYYGALYCIQHALPHLLKTKGVIAGVSSVSGFKALPGRAGYTASKHALNGLLESVKIENLKTGLHVTTICPGFTSTQIRHNALTSNGEPQGWTPKDETKMMSPQTVALHLIQAIQQKKDFVVLTKEGKIIRWLDKFAPKFISKKVFEVFAKETKSPIRVPPIND